MHCECRILYFVQCRGHSSVQPLVFWKLCNKLMFRDYHSLFLFSEWEMHTYFWCIIKYIHQVVRLNSVHPKALKNSTLQMQFLLIMRVFCKQKWRVGEVEKQSHVLMEWLLQEFIYVFKKALCRSGQVIWISASRLFTCWGFWTPTEFSSSEFLLSFHFGLHHTEI